jgi:hypothetical protein
MLGEPIADLRMLVRRVVVDDFLTLGDPGLDVMRKRMNS